jgi:hypothetical protein
VICCWSNVVPRRTQPKELDWIENYVLSQANRSAMCSPTEALGWTLTTVFIARDGITGSNQFVARRGSAVRGCTRNDGDGAADHPAGTAKDGEAGDARPFRLLWLASVCRSYRSAPFFSGSCPSVIWIDPATGCVCCDLERVPPRAKTAQRAKHTSKPQAGQASGVPGRVGLM